MAESTYTAMAVGDGYPVPPLPNPGEGGPVPDFDFPMEPGPGPEPDNGNIPVIPFQIPMRAALFPHFQITTILAEIQAASWDLLLPSFPAPLFRVISVILPSTVPSAS